MHRPAQFLGPNHQFLTSSRDGPPACQARASTEASLIRLSSAVAAHGCFLLLLGLLAARAPGDLSSAALRGLPRLVWIPQPSETSSDGGGGGGDPTTKTPAGQVRVSGRDSSTMPAAKPLDLESRAASEDVNRAQEVAVLAQFVAADPQNLPGGFSAVGELESRGPGQGSGGDGGHGSGSGGGDGAGLREGFRLGAGGDFPRPGNGVTWPRLVSEVKPAYTADAMRAKIQGVVLLDAVVLPDGTVGRVRVVRSLDSTFGLDREAVRAVQAWRFAPAMQQGRPVAVVVPVEVSFTMR